jgi:hypothetical protein
MYLKMNKINPKTPKPQNPIDDKDGVHLQRIIKIAHLFFLAFSFYS